MPEHTTTTNGKSRATRARAYAVAAKCEDAYSFDRYSTWKGCALLLALRGYSDREIEAILRSKYMRWAADSFNRHDRIPARAITEYLDAIQKRNGAEYLKREVAELVAGTFNGEGE